MHLIDLQPTFIGVITVVVYLLSTMDIIQVKEIA